MEKQNNYNKYWKNWNVLQTPKIDMDLLAESWDVYDVNINNKMQTVAKNGTKTITVDYSYTGGVNNIKVMNEDKVVYNQNFNFLLKPSVGEIQKVLECAGIEDWRKYYTAC